MDKLWLTPVEAGHVLGIGRSKIYELMRDGTLRSVRFDNCRRLPVDDLVAAASQEILDDPRPLEPDQRHEATVLLADPYEAGPRHGICTEHWALVASLGTAVLDTVRMRDRASGVAQRGRDQTPIRYVPAPVGNDRGRHR